MGMFNIFKTYNDTELNNSFFEDAFLGDYENIWRNTPAYNQANQMTYFHAMAVFLDDDYISERERRTLLYNYCKPFLSTSKKTDILRRMAATLPTSNEYVRKVVEAICSIYEERPEYSFEMPKAEKFKALIENSNYVPAMHTLHKKAKLLGESIIRPYFHNAVRKEPTLQFQIVTPDNYAYVTKTINGIEEPELWIQGTDYINGAPTYVFSVWDTRNFSRFTQDGKLIDAIENPYGRIPFSLLQLNGSNFGINNSFWELIKAQLDNNRVEVMKTNNEMFSSFSMIALFNYNISENDSIGPAKIFARDDINPDRDVIPFHEIIAPEPQYIELDELRKARVKETLRNYNLPSALIDETGVPQSGVAMKIDRIGLEEYRRRDINDLRNFEENFFQLVADVYNTDISKEFTNIDVEIEYGNQQYPEDPTALYELSRQKYLAGLISAKTHLLQTTDTENVADDKEAVEIMKENISMLNEISGVQDVGTDQANTGTDQANTGTDQANTGTDQANTGAETAEFEI